jgi:hypothetical protein
MARLCPLLSLLVLLPLAGCTRVILDHEKQFELSAESPSFTFTIPPIKKEQVIKVNVTADQPVSVLVGLAQDEQALKDEIQKKKFTDKTRSKELKAQEVKLETPIPANESAAILVVSESPKKTNVKVKITN